MQDIAPFHDSQHSALRGQPFVGPCTALGEGDRVVVVDGPHRAKLGYILMMRDVPIVHEESGQRSLARFAKLHSEYDGTSIIKKNGPGDFVDLRHVRRHILDNPLPLQLLDRVRVVSGVVHRGLTGRAVEINGEQVKVEIPTPTNTSDLADGRLPDTKCFEIHIRYLRRRFQSGDLVEVVRGRYAHRVGMIVACNTGGSLELFDVSVFIYLK